MKFCPRCKAKPCDCPAPSVVRCEHDDGDNWQHKNGPGYSKSFQKDCPFCFPDGKPLPAEGSYEWCKNKLEELGVKDIDALLRKPYEEKNKGVESVESIAERCVEKYCEHRSISPLSAGIVKPILVPIIAEAIRNERQPRN